MPNSHFHSLQFWDDFFFTFFSAEDVRKDIWFKHTNINVFHDGKVVWSIRSKFSTTCGLDMTYFPYDLQHCPITVGLQAYTEKSVNLSAIDDKVNLDAYSEYIGFFCYYYNFLFHVTYTEIYIQIIIT